LGDGRDLWVINPDFKITQYVDSYCLVPEASRIARSQKLWVNACKGKPFEEWEVLPMMLEGNTFCQIRSVQNRSLCVNYLNAGKDDNVCLEAIANATSTVDIKLHMASKALEDNPSYWRSNMDIENVEF